MWLCCRDCMWAVQEVHYPRGWDALNNLRFHALRANLFDYEFTGGRRSLRRLRLFGRLEQLAPP
jgi:hypothetical protein